MFLPQVPTLRFCILVNALCSLGSAVPYPEQVHLSFMGNNSVMAVSWITFEYDSTTVKYGPKSTNITFTAEDSVTEWTFGGITRYSHRAVMRELKPETEYYYQIGSRSFTFRTLAMNSQSYKVCIFGDLGYWHGNSTASIIKNGLAGKYDFIIHVGDISYDLHTNNGINGDKYMNLLEPIISKVPYMVIAGNHEDDGANFTNYQRRFWMPETKFLNNQFYSFDLGPIHWVGVSTENYGFYYEYGMDPVFTQYSWLKQDLAAANGNRQNVPWIITFQHRPFYCSNINSAECQSFENRLIRTGWLDMPGLEPLYIQEGIDIGFWGHEHSYERFWPIANRVYWNTSNAYHNPVAPVYIITGSAGCHTPDAKFTKNPWPWSSVRNNDYGYSIMTVANRTHIRVEQISIDKNEEVVDDFWVIKDVRHVHNDALRRINPGWKFPKMKCYSKDIACKMTLKQLNQEL